MLYLDNCLQEIYILDLGEQEYNPCHPELDPDAAPIRPVRAITDLMRDLALGDEDDDWM